MNIPQHHISSPQAMGVPSIHVQDPFSSRFDRSSSARTLPRAIPNARDDTVPGIPSMEAPQAIFGDHRHRYPQLPSLSNEMPVGSLTGQPFKGGIQSLKERYGRGFDAMEVDSEQRPSSFAFENARQQKPNEAPFPAAIAPPSTTQAESKLVQSPSTWNDPKSVSGASANDNLRSEGTIHEHINRSVDGYDRSLLRKLTSPVLPFPFPSSATGNPPPVDWNSSALLHQRSEEIHNSISGLPGSTEAFASQTVPTTMPVLPKVSAALASPMYETHSGPWSRSPMSNSTVTSPHVVSARPSRGKESKREEFSPVMDQRYSRERSPFRGPPSSSSMLEEEYEAERRYRRSKGGYDSRSYRGHSRRRRSLSYPSDEDMDMDDMPPEPKPRRLTLLTQGPSSSTSPGSYPSPRREKRRHYSPNREERHSSRRYYSPGREERHSRRYHSPERDERHRRRHYSPSREDRYSRRYRSPSREREDRHSRRYHSPPRDDRLHMASEPSRSRYLHEAPSEINKTTLSGRGAFKSQSGPVRSSTISSSRYPSQPHSSIVSSQSSGWSFQNSYEGDRASSVTSFSPESDAGRGSISGDSPYLKPTSSLSKSSSSYQRGHQRTVSEAVGRQEASLAAIGPKHHSAPKMLGALMCECCPKKPKKFENKLDLQMHELEKQYICQFCPHRFKNKNEAERHQNSLHLRKHSWSCAALQGVEAAFHASVSKPNLFDICGYCGNEFAKPADWDERMDHLSNVHKYGECNQQKKFFRADHFRQHLKHSHAGTSGKWANILENACRKDEINGITEEMD